MTGSYIIQHIIHYDIESSKSIIPKSGVYLRKTQTAYIYYIVLYRHHDAYFQQDYFWYFKTNAILEHNNTVYNNNGACKIAVTSDNNITLLYYKMHKVNYFSSI